MHTIISIVSVFRAANPISSPRTNLACSIDDFALKVNASVIDHLLEFRFNSGVILVYKVVFNELLHEGGLSYGGG